MSLSVFSYCICIFLCHCHSFNPSLCCLSPFLLSSSLSQGNVASENLPTGLHLCMEKTLSAFDEKNCLTFLWNCLVCFCETKEEFDKSDLMHHSTHSFIISLQHKTYKIISICYK